MREPQIGDQFLITSRSPWRAPDASGVEIKVARAHVTAIYGRESAEFMRVEYAVDEIIEELDILPSAELRRGWTQGGFMLAYASTFGVEWIEGGR